MKYTKQEILDLNPCSEALAFCEKRKFDPVNMWNTCERGDWMILALRRTKKLTKPMVVEIAIECSLHVIAIYEKKHPKDNRPREAIEAAQAWLKNPTDKNKRAAADAAYAASDADAAAAAYAAAAVAADAAYVAAAAADAAAAAYAAAAAAYAAYAADAAAYASHAAAYAAYAAYAADVVDVVARSKERKWQANKIREIVPCPFK